MSHYVSVSNHEKSWGLYVTGVGRAVIQPNGTYPPVVHPTGYDFKWERGRILEEYGLVYLTAGTGIFESTHQTNLPVGAGDCMVLFPGEWHRYRPDKASGWEEYWVTFQGSLLESWRMARFIQPQTPHFSGVPIPLLLPIFKDMLQHAEHKLHNRRLESAALCHLLMARLLSTSRRPVESDTREEFLHAAGEHLRLNLEKDVDLEGLAKRLGMSYSNFRRAFTKHFGVSPDRFHQEARVARIKQFLTQTDLPLKEIAARLGYSNEFYLMHVFKHQTGWTPTEWRRRRNSAPSDMKRLH